MHRHYGKLENDQQLLKKFQPVYLGLKLNSVKALLYTTVFHLRRTFIVLVNLFFTAGVILTDFKRDKPFAKTILFLCI